MMSSISRFLANTWNRAIFQVSTRYPKHKNPKSLREMGFYIQHILTSKGLSVGWNVNSEIFIIRSYNSMSNKRFDKKIADMVTWSRLKFETGRVSVMAFFICKGNDRAKCLYVVTHAGGVFRSSDNTWPFCLKATASEA